MKKLIVIIVILILSLVSSASAVSTPQARFWEFQAIDTMKYSRDLSREKLKDSSFDRVIDQQVKNIADVGATHVAIATPYDEEFYPFLKRWVQASRKYGLHVWLRGNFSGWEKWFGYSSISREVHIQKTKDFILRHKDLFVDGDIFTPCTECENGGSGDPRQTGDVVGYRKFLIEEYKVTKSAFKSIGKSVRSNYYSTNGDVARLIMDRATTQGLDGVVTIDHYVSSSDDLIRDVDEIAKTSGGQVILGEFGAPIPDIHGAMTDGEQAAWIGEALEKVANRPEVIGLNYWVSLGGTTRLWNENGTPRLAVEVLRRYFRPSYIKGKVVDVYNRPIEKSKVSSGTHATYTQKNGEFYLPYIHTPESITITNKDYVGKTVSIGKNSDSLIIRLSNLNPSFFHRILQYLFGF